MTPAAAARPRRIGHPRYSMTWPRTPETVPEVRRLVRVAVATWGLDTAADPAELALTELASNAVRHGLGRSIRVVIHRPAAACLYLAVVDRAPWRPPVVQPAAPDGEVGIGGRGLVLVDAYAERWGYDVLGYPRPWGKRVWAELSATEADS